mgnify:CR=1 FL=1
MELKELKFKYDNLLKDVDFDELELGLENPNIFEILKITKTEIRHSNFLSYLLDPKESHKLGEIFLKRFLREVFSSDKFNDIDQVDVEGMDLSSVEVYREWNNIDILIKLPNVVICIENKILSKEHSNQLSKYKNIIENHFPNHKQTFVFLNPEGDPSQDEKELYHPISYDFILKSLERIISVYGNSLNQQVQYYIKDYITIIKRTLMGTDKVTKLSHKIYKNHKDLFDFIFEHKPDVRDRVSQIMRDEISNRGWILGSTSKSYIRFYTKEMTNLIYINKEKNGWKKSESFLFEIELYPPSNTFLFKTVISPSDKEYNTVRLQEILMEIDGFKNPKGKKWLVNYTKREKFIWDEISTMSDEEITDSVNSFLEKISTTVQKVESQFIRYSKELMVMRSI